MAYLLNALSVEPGSRLTDVGDRRKVSASQSAAAVAQLLRLGEGQDPSLEADFLAAHLPLWLVGLQGTDPQGNPWLIVVQVAAEQGSPVLGARNPYWVMADSLDRALAYNEEAGVTQERGWQRPDLVEIYQRGGVEADTLESWTVSELVLGLVAESCFVPLPQIVAGKESGCAFPNLDHTCAKEVFTDVFTVWAEARDNSEQNGLVDADDYLLGWGGPEPTYATPATAGTETLYYWPERDLKKMSSKDLRKLAARCKWGKRKTSGMKRKALVTMLSTPHTRNKGKGALEVAGPVPD